MIAIGLLRKGLVGLGVVVACATGAEALPIGATAFLNGGNFIQSGTVTNTSVAQNIVQVTYSLGAAAEPAPRAPPCEFCCRRRPRYPSP